MGDLTSNVAKLELKENLFQSIKFFISGEVDIKVLEFLKNGGAERLNYFSDYVTHLIVGENPEENDIVDATDVYEVPAVTPKWIIICHALQKLVSLKPYLYSPDERLFSKFTFCFSQIREDRNYLWALITYNGGKVQLNFDKNCQFLVTTELKGPKFEKAEKIGSIYVKIVTPDWVVEAVKTGMLPDTSLFHPKLINWPKQIEYESTAAITGFEPEQSNIEENAEEKVVSDSTQALLDKLKQRMPWNQPKTPLSTPMTSISDPIAPPNVVAPSFMQKAQHQLQHQQNTLQKMQPPTSQQPQSTPQSPVNTNFPQIPSSPTASLNNQIPKSIIHHTPNQPQGFQQSQISQQQQHPLNINRLIGKPQPRPNLQLRGQLVQSQLQQQLLQQQQQQNQGNVIQRGTSSQVPIPQQLLQQQLAQRQLAQRQLLQNQLNQNQLLQQQQQQINTSQQQIIQSQQQVTTSQHLGQLTQQQLVQLQQQQQLLKQNKQLQLSQSQQLLNQNLQQLQLNQGQQQQLQINQSQQLQINQNQQNQMNQNQQLQMNQNQQNQMNQHQQQIQLNQNQQQIQLNQNQQQIQLNQNQQQIQLGQNQQQIQLGQNQQQIQLNQNQQQIQLGQNQQQIQLTQNQQQIQLGQNQQQIQLNQNQQQQQIQLNQNQQHGQLNQNQQQIQLNQNPQQMQLNQQIQLNQNQQQQIQLNQNQQQQIQLNQNQQQQQIQLNQNQQQQIQLNQNQQQQQIQLNQNQQQQIQLNQNQQQQIQLNQNQQQQIQLNQNQQQIQLNQNQIQQIQMNQTPQLQLGSNLQQIAINQNQQVQNQQQIMQNQVIQPQQQSPQQIQISQAQGFVQQNVNIISQNQQILQQKQFLLNQHQTVTSQPQFINTSYNQNQDLNQQPNLNQQQNLNIQNLNQQLSTHNLGQQLNQQQLNQQLTQHSPIGQSQQSQLVQQLNSQDQLEQRLSQQNQLNQINQQQNRLGQQNQLNQQINQSSQLNQQTQIAQQNSLSQQQNQLTQQQLNQAGQQQISQNNTLNQSTLDQELGTLNQQLNQGLNHQIQQQQLNRQNLQQQQLGQPQMQVQQQGNIQQSLQQQQLNQINQQVTPGLPHVVRAQFQQQNIGSQILINQPTSQNPTQRPQTNQHIWTQQPTQISGQQIIRHNVIQQQGGPRLQWSPTAQQGNAVPQRQFIQLDARTHQELQKMPPEQQAIFVAKIQRQRQLLKQVQQRGGSHILIRGNVPPGLTTQQQVQWLQQQAKQQGIVLPPNIQQQNITPGTLTQPTLAQNMQHAPGLSPINQNAAQFTDQNQQQQIQLRQFRLQQLQLQREQAQKNHLAQQQGTIQQSTVVRPIVQPPIADSTTNLPHVQEGNIPNPLVVNAKTKTALANMLNIKLQSGGSSVGVQRPDPIQEPSAAGTLRLMTAQHNAAINSKPQEIIALQRRTISGPNGEIIKPPGAQLLPSTPTTEPPKLQYHCQKPALTPLQHRPGPFYGHNPNLKLPSDLFLLGCVFVVVELEDFLEEKIPGWQEKIAKHGGEVEKQYCNRVTHVLCETQRHGVVMQALRDCKRCVTIIWLSDVMHRKQVLPPWTALHLPNIYLDTTPAAKHLISISGFEGSDRARVKQMIKYTGAKTTSYFSKHNTLLISAKADGRKCVYAKKWQIPVVNVQWLTDIMLGHFTALNQLEHQIYQQFPNPPNFSFDPKLVPNLMVAWKAPINISQESYERVKRVAPPGITPKKVKKPKVESTDENDNISDEVMADCSYKILFSLISDVTTMKQMVKELGGCVAKDHNDFTHLVMPQLARTNKLFFAIAREAHVVSEHWLKESHENNQFLPETKYTLHSKDFNFEYKCDIDQTFQTRNRSKLFDGKFFFVTPSVFPSRRIVVELIQSCGGIVEKHRRSSSQIEITTLNSPYSYFIITHEDDLHLVADLLKNKKDKMKVVCNAELIFSAVLKQTFEVDPYAVSVL